MGIVHQGETAGGGHVFDIIGEDPFGREDYFETDEQNLDDEAHRMMVLWDRNNLLQEVQEDKEEDVADQDYIQYYDGEKSFDELKEEMTSLEGEMVWIKIVEEKPKNKEILFTNTILFDCFGFLEYNPEPFESTVHEGRPKLLNLAGDDREGGLIPGLLQGILTLRRGERAHILIHPSMAYKEYGAYPIIPRDAHLFYCVKIHQVWDEGNFDGVLQYERQMHVLIPLQEKLQLASEHKEVAKQYLADDKPREALVRYKAAIKWLIETPMEEREHSIECKQLMDLLWQNISITMNKLGMHKSATKAAKQALSINPTNIKALYSLARARIALGDHDRALSILERAERISPDNSAILHLKTQIDMSLRVEKQKRDEIMLKMSKSLV